MATRVEKAHHRERSGDERDPMRRLQDEKAVLEEIEMQDEVLRQKIVSWSSSTA